MNTIETRDDIAQLVHNFYAKVRKDDLLGPIFNKHIPEAHWPAHLEKLTDFWETNLFGVRRFKGNPTQKHVMVDQHLNHRIDQHHFGQWLNLWFETIDALFIGERALKAKNAARNMASGQYIAIWQHRPEHLR